MREHTTTVTGWVMYEKLDGIARARKVLTTQINGCPYEINLEVILNAKELDDLGYNVADSDEVIIYGLEAHPCEKEMDVHATMWLHINAVKMVMSSYDTNSWRLVDWDAACPFLFDAEQTQHEEEVTQEERDTWD